jgi:hypothetical protein
MATYLHPDIYDLGLQELDTNGTRLDICHTEPTTYTQATSTYTRGNTTSLSIGAPAAGSPDGRQVTVAALSALVPTSSGTVGWAAISDPATSRLLAVKALNAVETVSTTGTFNVASFVIRIPAPA